MHRPRLDILLSRTVVVASLLLVASMAIATPQKVADFAFIHASDEHSDFSQTTPDNLKEMARLARLPSVQMKPYNISVPPPSFIVSAGDITDFGPVGRTYYVINKRYEAVGLPFYGALGNHDCTLGGSLTREWTKRFGSPYYSVDRNGCHFVILDSAGLNDYRANFNPEEITWLKADLAKTGTERPIFLAFHHTLDEGDFSCQYDIDRLLDVLRPYNIVLIMYGHGHVAKHIAYEGYDMVEGGSTMDSTSPPGFQVVSVLNGTLRVAYKPLSQSSPTMAMLEKPLFASRAKYPKIDIESPREQSSHDNEVVFKATTSIPKDSIAESYAMVDDKTKVQLARQTDGIFEGRLDGSGLMQGGHFARICFKDKSGSMFHRSTCFYVEGGQQRVLWRTFLGAASRSTPTISDNTVYVGANDGTMHAYDAKTGKSKWVFTSGGPIVGQPVVMQGKVIFGSEDEMLYAISASKGDYIWNFHSEQPIYSTPVTDGENIYFGSMNGLFYGVSASDGTYRWRNQAASCNIQTKPSFVDGKLCYGAWDTYIYYQNAKDGKLLWKCMAQGSAEGESAFFYSPAKSAPVVYGDRVYATDPKGRLSIIDIETGKQERFLSGYLTTGLSEDRKSLYLLKSNGCLTKNDDSLKEIWSASISTYTDSATVEHNGVVYICSADGVVTALAADSGKVLWQYKAVPYSYLLCSPGISDDAIFVVGTDASLTALKK